MHERPPYSGKLRIKWEYRMESSAVEDPPVAISMRLQYDPISCRGHQLSSVLRAAAFSRCRNVFFPLRQLFGLRKAGLSLLLVFFPASAGFFLASDGFFPAWDGFFPRCLQNAFFLLQRCFCAAARCFFCCFEFFPLRSGIFCWRFFPAAETAFSRCKAFFSCCQRCFFPFRCFFPAANLCFSRAARRQGARERRVMHWAFATCKLDSAWTNR